MRIYWCERHKLQAREPDHCEDGSEDAPRDDWCVVVPMRLIPDNAETIERIAATLKEVALAKINNGLIANPYPSIAVAILAVLDGETP